MVVRKSQHDVAWRIYPLPAGTDYTVADLANANTVIGLFDYCQILEAVILAKGWQILFTNYGIDGLIDINKKSGWFDEENDKEAEQGLLYQSRIAGYDPILDAYGTYNEKTGVFTPIRNTE